MLLRELQEIRSTLNKTAHQFGASRLRVFGSVARGEESPASAHRLCTSHARI